MWGSKRTERAPFDDLIEDRDRPEPTVETPVASPPVRAESVAVETPAPRREEPVAPQGSVLGRTLTFHGDLQADEDFVLQGRVEGSITHTGSLTIGENGTTVGNISARQIVVEGAVEGDIAATGSVSVRANGTVHGSIVAPRVALADGANFNGSIDMDSAGATSKSAPEFEESTGKKHAGGAAG
jgi:cytoskeletal protein CcmA (bactofilin family)